MHIGIKLGFILGILLLVIGFIGWGVAKQSSKSEKWQKWTIIAGACAILTAVCNLIKFNI